MILQRMRIRYGGSPDGMYPILFLRVSVTPLNRKCSVLRLYQPDEVLPAFPHLDDDPFLVETVERRADR
jgi:hypothetical protein